MILLWDVSPPVMNPLVGWWFRKKHSCLYEIYIRRKPQTMRSKDLPLELRLKSADPRMAMETFLLYWRFPGAKAPPALCTELEGWSNQDFSELAVWPDWDHVIKEPLVQMEGSSRRSAITAAPHRSDRCGWVARRKKLLCKRHLKAPKTTL